MTEVTITIEWANSCGEVVYTQQLSDIEVYKIAQDDPRAKYSNFVLPNGETVDNEDYTKWFAQNRLAFA